MRGARTPTRTPTTAATLLGGTSPPTSMDLSDAIDLAERLVALVGSGQAHSLIRAVAMPTWKRAGKAGPGRKPGAVRDRSLRHRLAAMIEQHQDDHWWRSDAQAARALGKLAYLLRNRNRDAFAWASSDDAARKQVERRLREIRGEWARVIEWQLRVAGRLPAIAEDDTFTAIWRHAHTMTGLHRLPSAARPAALWRLLARSRTDSRTG